MKARCRLLVLAFALTIPVVSAVRVQAQPVPLPYTTTFDPHDDRQVWTEYRLGYRHTYHWNASGAPPYMVSHDYPVGGLPAMTDTVFDWLVSPALQFQGPASLSMRLNVFTITGSTTASDYFGVWYSSGERDPGQGEYVEVVDLTNYSTTGEWLDTAQISVPSTSGRGYLALVYRARTNWFTVGVSDITVASDTSSSVNNGTTRTGRVSVYPNPSTSAITVDAGSNEYNPRRSFSVFSLRGEEVWKGECAQRLLEVRTDGWPAGIYFYRLSEDESLTEAGQFVVQQDRSR